jgi:uncharacterized protein (DUF1684 family)
MNIFFSMLLLLIVTTAVAQTDSVTAVQEIKKFQDELNAEFQNPKESPLGPTAAKDFKTHLFFPIDLKFRVIATLTVTPDETFFEMRTSTSKVQKYRKYGWVRFSIDGKKFKLPVYQSQVLMKTEEYKNYLFLPFTDLTNGEETYSAGRYLGLRIPAQGDELIIDFNQSYNPYCAYSDRYSCPIVPKKNHLNTKILAGTLYSWKRR